MKPSRRNLFFILLAAIVATLTTTTTLRGREQVGDKATLPKRQQEQEEFESQFPATGFEASEPTDPDKRALRQKKSKQYDNSHFVNRGDASSAATESVFFDEWDAGLPALPSSQSEVIVIGDVTDAQANLSNDKTGIYSEFTVTIEEILKNGTPATLAVNSAVCLDRQGGAVLYPSKGKYLYRVAGQGMPRVGRRYVFFLKATDLAQTFRIVTAYELRSGRVFPLDSAEQFNVYKGVEATKLLDALWSVIGRSGTEIN
ncbi:MAG: hypothetical protein QOJ70_1905 [Acidobacteriota bacterium]|nr:hypothetical protein [Acidobacteriota bacterium]